MRAKPAVEEIPPASSGLQYEAWLAGKPNFAAIDSNFDSDLISLKNYNDGAQGLLRLSAGGKSVRQDDLVQTRLIRKKINDARAAFLRVYAETLYHDLTDNFSQSIRLEALIDNAICRYQGLLPSATDIKQDATRSLKEKEGHERAIGLFCSHIFANLRAGIHLLQSMLRPLPSSLELGAKFKMDGILELGTVVLRRNGKAAEIQMGAEKKMVAAIQAEGLSPQRYTEIIRLAQVDGELNQKLRAEMEG